MEHQQSKADIYEKFTWKIENFSRLEKKIYSEPFILCGYPWRILIFPKGNAVQYLSIYLEARHSTDNIPVGWSRDAKFSFIVIDQLDSERTIKKDTFHMFSVKEQDWGFTSFMSLGELNDPQKGFLVKDTCTVGVEVSVSNANNEKQVTEAASLTTPLISSGQTGHTEVEVTIEPTKHTDVELFSAAIGDLMDFRGLGQIEKPFVPLLEEVCSNHPSLIECQQKRSRKFSGWAFNALGRVLYFLKTTKLKDMNDQCCKDLQTLWEELKTFEFDMTWLEPHVQSTLGMKNYVEKALEVQQLKAKLVVAEENLDAESDLLKAKGVQVRDLDAELGYGS